MTFATEAAAIAHLTAEGFKLTASGDFYTKPSKVDDYLGGYSRSALCTIEHRRVDPKWNAPDFYEIKFH